MQYKNIYIYKNSPYVQFVTILTTNGLPENVTGYTGKLYLSKHYESATKYAVDVLIENAVGGVMKVSMSAASTAQLPAGNMVYSVFITPLEQEEKLLMQGMAIVESTVHL